MIDSMKVYNLDEPGSTSVVGSGAQERGFINVFEMNNREKLKEVTFFESAIGASCQAFYVPIGEGGQPNFSERIAISDAETINYSGYHTLEVNNNIIMETNSKCGIMIYVKNATGTSIGFEASQFDTIKATANPGESYFCSSTGGLTDITSYNYGWGNFSIKLITEKQTINISECDIFHAEMQGYTGSTVEPYFTVKYNGIALIRGKDYGVGYSRCVNVGTGTIVIIGLGDFTGMTEFNFTITNDLSYAEIVGLHDCEYTGSEPDISPYVRLGSKILVQNVDYIVTRVPHYSISNVDTYYYYVIGINKYEGQTYKTFSITAANIQMADIGSILPQEYTGSEIEPKPNITFNGINLEEGVDYTLTYSNNIETGTAIVTINGIGNFTGSVNKTFIIN